MLDNNARTNTVRLLGYSVFIGNKLPSDFMISTFAKPVRGWERLYIDHVMQADRGADFDFLFGASGSSVPRESH